MKTYFVTGFHRGGTHFFAEYLAKKKGVIYIEESVIDFDNFNKVKDICSGFIPTNIKDNNKELSIRNNKLDNGIVIQCPMLAPMVIELSELGKVYWCVKDEINLVTSMKNGIPHKMLWDIVKGFKKQFPDDSIWDKISYDGKEDVFDGFIKYSALIVKIKNYFYNNYFKDKCEIVKLEDQSYYDPEIQSAVKRPLNDSRRKKVIKVFGEVL